MLTALAIRDVVLIERLDLAFGPGLTVLTGETGAGKSILLDSLGLALGARAEQGLLRPGAEQASVSAEFVLPQGHAAAAMLAANGIGGEETLVLRRVLGSDGRSRAFVNDQPVGVTFLRQLGATLVEVQGQQEQLGLIDAAAQTALLDAYGVAPALSAATARSWQRVREAGAAAAAAKAALAAAEREEEWLRHAVAELGRLKPMVGEEAKLAAERTALQRSEQRLAAIRTALAEIAPRERRGGSIAATVRAAARGLRRLLPPPPAADASLAAAVAALERAEEALVEAEDGLARLLEVGEADPRRLEALEERLFALRAAARKHQVTVEELPALLDALAAKLAVLENREAEAGALESALAQASAEFAAACAALTAARRCAAARLEQAVAAELPPLRLGAARFSVAVEPLAGENRGERGADLVRFLVATNPGQAPGPLARVASGGELARFTLALKVALAGASSVPTLVFDEVDAGVGGATAAAVGERLARVAQTVQVLLVTHSPQVAARGAAHLLVSKEMQHGKAVTVVRHLKAEERREEIARMLAGEEVTEAARAAAASLLVEGK